MNDIILTGHSAWSNISEDGLSGYVPDSGTYAQQVGLDYEVHEDGTVTCTEGYEAIVGEGHITGFRILEPR